MRMRVGGSRTSSTDDLRRSLPAIQPLYSVSLIDFRLTIWQTTQARKLSNRLTGRIFSLSVFFYVDTCKMSTTHYYVYLHNYAKIFESL